MVGNITCQNGAEGASGDHAGHKLVDDKADGLSTGTICSNSGCCSEEGGVEVIAGICSNSGCCKEEGGVKVTAGICGDELGVVLGEGDDADDGCGLVDDGLGSKGGSSSSSSISFPTGIWMIWSSNSITKSRYLRSPLNFAVHFRHAPSTKVTFLWCHNKTLKLWLQALNTMSRLTPVTVAQQRRGTTWQRSPEMVS